MFYFVICKSIFLILYTQKRTQKLYIHKNNHMCILSLIYGLWRCLAADVCLFRSNPISLCISSTICVNLVCCRGNQTEQLFRHKLGDFKNVHQTKIFFIKNKHDLKAQIRYKFSISPAKNVFNDPVISI